MDLLKKQLLVDFQNWIENNIHIYLSGDYNHIATKYLEYLEAEELKKDELYKQNFIR